MPKHHFEWKAIKKILEEAFPGTNHPLTNSILQSDGEPVSIPVAVFGVMHRPLYNAKVAFYFAGNTQDEIPKNAAAQMTVQTMAETKSIRIWDTVEIDGKEYLLRAPGNFYGGAPFAANVSVYSKLDLRDCLRLVKLFPEEKLQDEFAKAVLYNTATVELINIAEKENPVLAPASAIELQPTA